VIESRMAQARVERASQVRTVMFVFAGFAVVTVGVMTIDRLLVYWAPFNSAMVCECEEVE